jgi:hypothetical protein
MHNTNGNFLSPDVEGNPVSPRKPEETSERQHITLIETKERYREELGEYGTVKAEDSTCHDKE